MDQSNWQKIEELFNAVSELPTEKRDAFLDSVCVDDEVRSEVESLLANAETQDSFLGKPNFSLGLTVLGKRKEHLLIGEKIGRYEILKMIGEGGMGEVYLAEDLPLKRQVALKLLPEYLGEEEENVARFQKEAFAASAISHPNIAHIYEAGIENNRRFIAMEFVEGKTLRELLKEKKIDIVSGLDIICQVANALVSAHQAGIVHRDIKPENIMIRRDGYVKVLDFGIAKLFEAGKEEKEFHLLPRQGVSISLSQTNPGLIMGTMGYVSPEQLKNKNVDLRTDIWSLGVVLYEVLTGTKPFKGKTTKDIRKAILRQKPTSISLSNLNPNDGQLLQNILSKMLNKDAVKRYQSAGDLADELKSLKQNLEFTQQFSTDEMTDSNLSSGFSGTFGKTGTISFFTKSKQFWNNQGIFRKGFLLIVFVSLLIYSSSLFGRLISDRQAKLSFFSTDSRNNLQISTLFSSKRRPNGAISEVSFSPDGNWIAFALSSRDSSDIYIQKIGQNEPLKVTEGKWRNRSPIWSSDGKQIAFVSNRDNKQGIWVMPAMGGTPVLQTSVEETGLTCYLRKWSNDGKRIFYEYCKKLYKTDLVSKQTLEIPFSNSSIEGGFNIAKDEKSLTYVVLENNKRQIWLQSLESNEAKPILQGESSNWSPFLFPDNQGIAYASNQNGISQLYVTDIFGKQLNQITFGDVSVTNPVISPDGSKIAYVSEVDEANIFSFDLRENKETFQTSNTKLQLFPSFSANKKLVFQTIAESVNIFRGNLRIKNSGAENEPNQLNLTGGYPKWNPNKPSFAFLRQKGVDINIWKADESGKEEKQLTENGIAVEGYTVSPFNLSAKPFDWSPDGKKIVYASKQSGFHNVWTIDENGENQQMLTNNQDASVRFSSAHWSAGGSQIACISNKKITPKESEYSVLLLKNGQTVNIYKGSLAIHLLGWLTDQTELLAAVEIKDSKDIELVKVSTNSNIKPIILSRLADVRVESLSLSPDRKSIAYSADRNGVNNIYLYQINGMESRLTANLDDSLYYSGIDWSPDGKNLFYSKQTGGLQISMISGSN